MDLTDAALIEASLTKPEIFGAIFDRHFAAIYGFCASRVGPLTGEDLAGETFLRAFAGRRLFDVSRQNARPWLFGIALNVVRERLRAVERESILRHSGADLGVGPVDPAMLAAASTDALDELQLVARALRDLPPDEVETLLLHVWDGLSYAECADALGVPLGTVRSRLNRVRARLKRLFEEPAADSAIAPIVPLHLLGGSNERPA